MNRLNKITLAALLIISGLLGTVVPIATQRFDAFSAFMLALFITSTLLTIKYKDKDEEF